MQTHAEYQVMLVLLSKRAASHIKPIIDWLHYWLDRYRQADVSQGLKWTPAIRRQTIKDEMPSETCPSNHNSLYNYKINLNKDCWYVLHLSWHLSAFHHSQKFICTWSHPLSRQNSSHSHHAQLIFSLSRDNGRTCEIWRHCGAALLATCVALPIVVAPATTVTERKYFKMTKNFYFQFFCYILRKINLIFLSINK